MKEKLEKHSCKKDCKLEPPNGGKRAKTIKIDGIKENTILKFNEINLLLSECCNCYTYPSKILNLENYVQHILISRDYYSHDLEELINNKTVISVKIPCILHSICNVLLNVSEYEAILGNLKSSNVVSENFDGDIINIKISDLFLNTLRKENVLRLYDICFLSPEELKGEELSKDSVIWSIGCILYELLTYKLPFLENGSKDDTMQNILQCRYNNNELISYEMQEMLERILKVKIEDRLSLNELRSEVIKKNGILKDENNLLMIVSEEKEILLNNDIITLALPTLYSIEYYLKSNEWESININININNI